MILIDIPMPPSCMDCPCSYMVRSGEHDGETMCNAMEARGDGIVVVDGYETRRPADCPIKLELNK